MPVNFDARTTAKFSMIMETMGCILLDFNNKPKQLDRFLGYIAMVHKDMRLNEQDMHVRMYIVKFIIFFYMNNKQSQCVSICVKKTRNFIFNL